MKIRRLQRTDVPAVANLHATTLKSGGSLLGDAYLIPFYTRQVLFSDIHIAYIAEVKEEIVGVITATYDLSKTDALWSMTEKLMFGFRMVKIVLTGSMSIGKLLERPIVDLIIHRKFDSPYGTILTLCVAASHQRHGIGRKLVDACIHDMRKHTNQPIRVDTECENISALAFYRACGFTRTDRIHRSIILTYDRVH